MQLEVNAPFRFVAYGDTRWMHIGNRVNQFSAHRRVGCFSVVRVSEPFISVGGDISYNGDDLNDWKIWDDLAR